MRKIIWFRAGIAAGVLLVLALAPGAGRVRAEEGLVPVWRMYNAASGEHFYTVSDTERDALMKRGWQFEGAGWFAPSEGASVWRFCNLATAEHFYTADPVERAVLAADPGWQAEGVAFFSAGFDGIPLKRCFDATGTGRHLWTSDSYEEAVLTQNGWQPEGTGWYAAAAGDGNASRFLGANTLVVSDPFMGLRWISLYNPDLPEGDCTIWVAVWSCANGQDDLRWYGLSSWGDGLWGTIFSDQDHMENGPARADAYAWTPTGAAGIASGSFEITDVSYANGWLRKGDLWYHYAEAGHADTVTTQVPTLYTQPGYYISPMKTDTLNSSGERIEAMIQRAYEYIGTPYRVCTSRQPGAGADCSGLVMQCLYAAGFDPAPATPAHHALPQNEYDSRTLFAQTPMMHVSYSQLRRGDLVFYRSSRANTIIHVAIYLGNGRVIESWPPAVTDRYAVLGSPHTLFYGAARPFP